MTVKTKKELKQEKKIKLIGIKELKFQTLCRELSVLTYQSLINVPTDVRFFKTEACQITLRLYSYSRLMYDDHSYFKPFKLKFENLRSLYRILIELKLLNGEFAYQMAEKFHQIDEELTSLKL